MVRARRKPLFTRWIIPNACVRFLAIPNTHARISLVPNRTLLGSTTYLKGAGVHMGTHGSKTGEANTFLGSPNSLGIC